MSLNRELQLIALEGMGQHAIITATHFEQANKQISNQGQVKKEIKRTNNKNRDCIGS